MGHMTLTRLNKNHLSRQKFALYYKKTLPRAVEMQDSSECATHV